MKYHAQKSIVRKTSRMLFFIALFGLAYYSFFQEPHPSSLGMDFSSGIKEILLIDGGVTYASSTQARTVEDFLEENHIILGEGDIIFPESTSKICGKSNIIIRRAKRIAIMENGKKREYTTFAESVEQAIFENKEIVLAPEDMTVPARSAQLRGGDIITVTHVLIKEEIISEPIAFKTIVNEDPELSWRTKKVTQKGEQGVYAMKYKVVYHDGKEISRKLLEKNKAKDPTEEIVTQGTLVKVGKVHAGVASWYAFRGGLFAANPWLPMGSYVRVINQDNGKSVIVKINDRGPFGNGRIIDLDKVAFAKIASIGAGVANIKMEVIIN